MCCPGSTGTACLKAMGMNANSCQGWHQRLHRHHRPEQAPDRRNPANGAANGLDKSLPTSQPFNKASHSSQRTKPLRHGFCGSLARWISIDCTWPDHAEPTTPPQDTAEHAEPDRLQRSSKIKLNQAQPQERPQEHNSTPQFSLN